jgi:GAF domain-containing protein
MTAYPQTAPITVTEAFEQLGRLSLAEESLDSVLQTVVDLAKRVLPGDLETSVSVLVADKPATFVYTGQLALDLDESQYGRGHGPCLQAAAAGEVVEITDARTEQRWPDYTQRAVELGSLSSLSVPLGSLEQLHAGINIYARRPAAFDAEARQTAARFARFAGGAAANVHAYQGAREMADNLQAALLSRAVIDQAKGILMERHRLTPDQAFHLLARASMAANRKLRTVAEHLVETGELVTPPGR